jgi:glucose 1-dehydrogenase
MLLKGKVAIVTGSHKWDRPRDRARSGKAGANIAIDYVAHPEATDALESEISRLGAVAIGVEADVSRIADLQALIDATVAKFGRVDIMVNNAGVETRTSVLDTTEDQYDKVLAINLKSAFFGTQIAAKQMIAQGGGGRIINITSVHEDWPMPGNTAYCLAKGGMRMLTRTAGVELAPHGIRVVGVGPGAVATPINLSTMNDPALLAKLNAAIPLGRMAEPEEIANVVVFLAGDGASYLTATTIFADGGIMQSSVGCSAVMQTHYDVIIIAAAGGGTSAPTGALGKCLSSSAVTAAARGAQLMSLTYSRQPLCLTRKPVPAGRQAIPAAGALFRRWCDKMYGAAPIVPQSRLRDATLRRQFVGVADHVTRS